MLCRDIVAIEVDDSRVTIHTDLQDDGEGRAVGYWFCLLIASADVADQTPGHEVQGGEGETLKACNVPGV